MIRRAGRPPRTSRAAAWLVAGALVAGAFVAAGGCTLLVPGEPTDVRCTEEGAIGPPVCPVGTFCADGACRAGPPALGEPCGDERVCAPGDACFDPASVGLEGQALCSRPCCSSADCGVGTGLVCAVLGPGKMCLPAEVWGRSLPGARFAGEPCSSGADCRSGECSSGTQRCADACCSDAECGLFAGACRDDGAGWACGPSLPGARAYLEPCAEDAECASGLCLDWADGARRCSSPCCSSVECGDVPAGEFVLHVLCLPVQHGPSIVHACASLAKGDAVRAVGAPCDDPSQCRGGRCIEIDPPGGKVCSDVCCTDASCGAPHLFVCTPAGDLAEPAPGELPGRAFDLQCVPR